MTDELDDSVPQSFLRKYKALFLLLSLVALAWVLFGIVVLLRFGHGVIGSGAFADTGAFGDTYGVLNTLFSGMAFAAFVYTIFLQHKELALQRQELQNTRAELRGQKLELEEQNETASRRRFESTFFQMLELHHKIVEAIRMNSAMGNQPISGREALRDLADYLIRETATDYGPRSSLEGMKKFYLDTFGPRQHALSHYFRNLYRVFKLIEDSNLSDKHVYSGIARAQLSSSELVLLFFNCLSCHGEERFKPLTEKFALLEHLPKQDKYMQRFRKEYKPAAFGTNLEDE